MKKRKLLTSLSILMALVFILGACGNKTAQSPDSSGQPKEAVSSEKPSEEKKASESPTEVKNEPKELIIGTYMPITTLVPWKTTSDGDGYVIRQIYHTLVEMNKESKFTPSLAKSWECAEDGVTWTIKLRDDVYWQTGNGLFGDEKVQVTAEDVKYSYEYYLLPETGSVRYSNLIESIKSIDVIDDFTIQFVTNDIDVLFEYKMYQNYIIPKKGVEEGWDFHAFPVGSGAYKFVEHVIDSHVILEKNEDYWKEPALDKITYKIITDKSVSAIALQNKEIDIALAVLPTEVGAIASKDYLTITDSGIGSLRWIGFNCGHPLFTDPEIRKALTMAVDIDGAVKAIFANDANIDLAVRAYGPISPERPGSNQEGWKGLTPSYNPEEAQKILESKGWAKGSDGIYAKDGQRFSFKLQVGNNDANREKLAVIVSSQLQAIGIECTAQTVEWGTHTDDIKYGNVEMYILGGYGNLDGPYRLMHSDESNFSPNCKYASDEVDRLLEEAYKTIDYDARVKLIYDASAIFISENAHLGGYFEYAQVGYNNRVTDFDYATVYNALCSEERNVGIAD